MRKHKNKCPCEQLIGFQKEIDDLKEQLKLMHKAVNRVVAEYGRLNFEERTLKNIIKLCDEDVLLPELIMTRLEEIREICKKAKGIISSINEDMPKL